MALDGVMLRLIKSELEARLLDSKVDKIHQPSREELVFVMRGREGATKLLVSAKADCPRIHITNKNYENPAQPPMLCMLLRKKMTGARLRAVRQAGLDRVLMLDFEGLNELGDMRTLTLTVEIMGRCSNAVLQDENGRIIDALKRVDGAMSSARMILPGLNYSAPPIQDKLNLLETETEQIIDRIRQHSAEPLHKAILSAVQGVSPVISRELSWRVCGQTDAVPERLPENVWSDLEAELRRLRDVLEGKIQSSPVMLSDGRGRPFDISIMNIGQYGEDASAKSFCDFSSLLDAFFHERDNAERIKVTANDLLRVLSSASDRVARRLTVQRSELEKARGREQLRLFGDLINANIYRIEKGQCFCELENYYDSMKPVRVSLDPMLTPSQNAQAYYKEYRRAQTAESHLVPLIEQGEAELAYLDEVFDSLSRAATNGDVAEIRAELTEEGYIKRQRQNGKKQNTTLPPLRFRSDDGFDILVGRNNRQNDRLSLKEAGKSDIWLHACRQPGAHVIINAHGASVPDSAIEQAAIIAACYCKGRESGLVAVDYTFAKHVYKLPGAKPGMVNYTDQQTVYVHPDKELAERLAVK